MVKMRNANLYGRDEYVKLASILLKYESVRVSLLRPIKISFYVIGILALTTLVLFITGINDGIFFIIPLSLFVSFFSPFVIYSRSKDKILAYGNKYVMPNILNLLWYDYKKSQADTIDYKYEDDDAWNISKQNPCFEYDSKKRNNLIFGTMNDKQFYTFNSQFGNGKYQEYALTFVTSFDVLFSGLVCVSDVKPTGTKGFFSSFKDCKQIPFPEFSAGFCIYSNNPVMAKQIVNQELINRITKFTSLADKLFVGIGTHVVIRDGKIEYYIPYETCEYDFHLMNQFEQYDFNCLCDKLKKTLQLVELITAD